MAKDLFLSLLSNDVAYFEKGKKSMVTITTATTVCGSQSED
jgi:hypothetical protein